MQLTKRIYSNLDLRKQKLKSYGGVVSTIPNIIETPNEPIDFDISWEFLGLDISEENIGDIEVKLPKKDLLHEGKRIEITDIGGNALTSNIVIYAGDDTEINGKEKATINTNFGSIILRYVEEYGWRVIGFVN